MKQAIIQHPNAAIEIEACQLDCDSDIRLDRARSLLSDCEQRRMRSFVFDRDAKRFARSRGFLRRVLGRSLGIEANAVPIARLPNGKPFVPGTTIDFNLSHSGPIAVTALATAGSVGIDIELCTLDEHLHRDIDGLGQTCLTREENNSLKELPPEEKIHCFLQYWTAKESRMKLTGEGLALDPKSISLELKNGQPVGYLRTGIPQVQLDFVPLPDTKAICCVAYSSLEVAGKLNASEGHRNVGT